MTSKMISLHVDRKQHHVVVEAETTLLEILREKLGFTGVKAGCREGGCGSCSVLVDGQLALSCLLPAARVDACSVETIEGLATGFDELHPIQQAFMENGASQCGFCTSGMIMATKALLESNPQPSRDDACEAIAGNVCRCTGYQPIVNAVLDAAKRLSES
jgi:aerobic carbon-monoxide dehydrogenase small subunit